MVSAAILPISPLDGGRVVKSLMYSFHGTAGFIFSFVSFLIAAVLGCITGLFTLTVIALIGFIEMLTDYGLRQHINKFGYTMTRLLLASLIFLFVQITANNFWQMALIWTVNTTMVVIMIIQLAVQSRREWGSILFIPWTLVADVFIGFKQLFSLKPEYLVRVDGMEPMKKMAILLYFLYFVGTIAIMAGIVLFANQLPGCGLAMEMLK